MAHKISKERYGESAKHRSAHFAISELKFDRMHLIIHCLLLNSEWEAFAAENEGRSGVELERPVR